LVSGEASVSRHDVDPTAIRSDRWLHGEGSVPPSHPLSAEGTDNCVCSLTIDTTNHPGDRERPERQDMRFRRFDDGCNDDTEGGHPWIS
jgi:hypothetical protein